MSTLTLTGAGPETGTVFTPASLPGLMAWYDLSLEAGADASALASVADRSGNGRTLSQATGTLQPLVQAGVNGINSLKAAKFDGIDDFMATAAFASPTAGVSVFAVVKFRVAPAGIQTVAEHAAAASWITPFARWGLRANGVPKFEGWVEDASVSPANFVTSTATVVTTAEARGFVYDQASLTFYKDGVADGVNARTGAITSSTQPLFVGAHTAGGEYLDAKLGELVVCNNGLSAGNISSLSAYLRGKWGTP